MSSRRQYLLGAVSVFAVGMVAAPASAFDLVEWRWWLDIVERIDKNVTITVDLTPSGLVLLENLQIFIGDVNAVSTVFSIHNDQPAPGGPATAVVDLGTLHFETDYALGGDFITGSGQICTNSDEIDDCTPFTGNVDEDDVPPNINGRVSGDIELGEVEVEVIVEPEGSFDALTELPEVVSAATAVGNNSSIRSSVMVEMHEGQFVFNVEDDVNGDTGDAAARLGAGLDGESDIQNTNLKLAGLATIGAVLGFIDPAQITATSTVFDILNATVDSTATAVANNKSITVEPATPDDAVLMADIVQFAYADVTAVSTVFDVSLNNYTNLGVLDRPIVSSVATAVGNNLNISVGIFEDDETP